MDIINEIENFADIIQDNTGPQQQQKNKQKNKGKTGKIFAKEAKKVREPLFAKRKEIGDDKYTPPGMAQQALLGSKGVNQAQSFEEVGTEALSKITDTAKKTLGMVADVLRSKVETKSSVIAALLGVRNAGAEEPTKETPNLTQPILGGR